MSILFLLPFISGLWSQDTAQWAAIVRIKLPLLMLPLCFAHMPDLQKDDWKIIGYIFIIAALSGLAWSLWWYVQNAGAIHAEYLRAQTMRTPLENDHVRFSLLVALAALTGFVLVVLNDAHHPKSVISLYVAIAIFVVYLHILAARTGLVCLYVGSLCLVIWLFQTRRLKVSSILFFFLVPALSIAAYFVLPSLRNRVSYFRYDFSLVKKNVFVPGSNDGDRLISLKAGWFLMNLEPLNGVGFGDVREGTEEFDSLNYPALAANDRILPSSEWMMYGAACGWPGFILFSLVMLMPFFIRGQRTLPWILPNLFAALSYLFDIGLEVQYGVFLHGFILLWWYKWLKP